jgi:CBS domain-containing protein
MSLVARDVMTREVVGLAPGLSVPKAAAILSAKGISAAPVLDEAGHVVGMCSEGDLMHQTGALRGGGRSWWLDILSEGEDLSPEFLAYVRTDKRSVADVMHRGVISADEDMSLPDLAALLDGNHVKRVPILREGKLVGIVSRADLIRAMASDPGALQP